LPDDGSADLADETTIFVGQRHPATSCAELAILSRERIDIDGSNSARQSANFRMNQWVRTISPARTA
jgi:hypothetical protein